MKFNYPCVERTPQQNNKVFRAIFQNSAIWKPGQRGTITIDFLETLPDPQKYASSMVGPSRDSPSMYLGYIDPPLTSFRSVSGKQFPMPSLREIRNHCSSDGKCPSGWVPGSTVVHEFGHALGMLHEHQNDMNLKSPIKLDLDNVYKWYEDSELTRQDAESNTIEFYKCSSTNTCQYSGSKFDPYSIMLYSIPDDWMARCNSGKNCVNGRLRNPTYTNFSLSAMDKRWLSKKYNGIAYKKNPVIISVKFLNGPEWKKAWVEKIVTESFSFLKGIKWNFGPENFEDFEGFENEETSEEEIYDDDQERKKSIIIAVVVILILLLFILLVQF